MLEQANKKLSILILSDYAFVKGGAEKVAISSSISLADRGHKVVFFSSVGPISAELQKSRIYKIVCIGQKDILDNPNRFAAIFNGIYNVKALKELKKELKLCKPDLVHIHGISKALSWATINLIHKTGIPIVYTLHDYGLICPNLGIYDFKKDKICQYYKPGKTAKCFYTDCDKRNYLQKLWRWVRFFINLRIFKVQKKISLFIAVSNFIKDTFCESNFSGVPIEVLYNPIEKPSSSNMAAADFKKSGDKQNTIKYFNKQEKLQFLYVGRLSHEKGVDILLDAISNVDANLVIIGDGELISYCRDKANKLPAGKIKVLGYQNKEIIENEMARSLTLILPSRCMEPAPLVIGEAALNKLPSIVAGHGGLKELVINGISGLYFDPNSVESLIKAILKFSENPQLRVNIGNNACRIFEDMGIDIKNHTNKLENIYRSIINSRL